MNQEHFMLRTAPLDFVVKSRQDFLLSLATDPEFPPPVPQPMPVPDPEPDEDDWDEEDWDEDADDDWGDRDEEGRLITPDDTWYDEELLHEQRSGR